MSVDLSTPPDSEDAWAELAELEDLLRDLATDDESHFQSEAQTLLRELEQRGEI